MHAATLIAGLCLSWRFTVAHSLTGQDNDLFERQFLENAALDSSSGLASSSTPTATNTAPSGTTSAIVAQSTSGTQSTVISVSSNTLQSLPASTTSVLQSTIDTTTTSLTTSATASDPTTISNTQSNALPYEPKLTPAIGVGGALLLLSGPFLCFLGLQNEPVRIFMSTALLVALAIEVLIIHVMTVPVSVGREGVYLVAGVLGGAAIGGFALVFPDFASGFATSLGGFSFAMWLLTLAPGSLIHAIIGRQILIAIFTVICFPLPYFKPTKNYSVIVCTALAGATTIVLGVDFFSSAGLKEFWLYIWNLNANEFPIGTTTYPFTGQIKIEVACIPIAAAIGIAVQLNLRSFSRRMERRRALHARIDEENRQDPETSQWGEQRQAWARVHGNKAFMPLNSGPPSTSASYKTSILVHEKEVQSIGASQDSRSLSTSSKPSPMVTVQRSTDSLNKRNTTHLQLPRSISFMATRPGHHNEIAMMDLSSAESFPQLDSAIGTPASKRSATSAPSSPTQLSPAGNKVSTNDSSLANADSEVNQDLSTTASQRQRALEILEQGERQALRKQSAAELKNLKIRQDRRSTGAQEIASKSSVKATAATNSRSRPTSAASGNQRRSSVGNIRGADIATPLPVALPRMRSSSSFHPTSTPPHSLSRQPSFQTPTLSRAPSSNNIFDSHQPRRVAASHSASKDAQNWSTWRSSQAIYAAPDPAAAVAEDHIHALHARQRQSAMEAQQRVMLQQAWQDQIDLQMRMGGLDDLHREKLRKMQNRARESLG